jgi:hypothetical protein
LIVTAAFPSGKAMNEDLIADLDDALMEYGDDVILRRRIANVAHDLPCKAHVTAYRLRDTELVTNTAISQEDLVVIMSPSEIAAAGWPGSTPTTVDQLTFDQLPRKGDKLVIRNKERNIEVVDPHRPGGTVVRFDMRVLG